MTLEKFCCEKVMKKVNYGLSRRKTKQYYKCVVNEDHMIYELKSEGYLEKISKVTKAWKNRYSL